jgi:hypothetical protein
MTAIHSSSMSIRLTGETTMRVAESKDLKKGTRVYWRGGVADAGTITGTSWDAVTIAWDNGEIASVHHGDMREIQQTPARSKTA